MNQQLVMAILGLCGLLSSAPAQRIWRVNCAGGPNVDYTDLPPAVVAAAPGDTIFVYFDTLTCPGIHQGYSGSVVDKPLNIVGFHTFGVSGQTVGPTHAVVIGALTVRNIPAGQRVLLSNLGLTRDVNLTPPATHGVAIENCDGEVLLEDLFYSGDGYQNSVVRIDDCAKVTLRGCTFLLSGTSLDIRDSNVLLTNTFIQWSLANIFNGIHRYLSHDDSVTVTNSSLAVIASVIRGPSSLSFGPQYTAESAIRVDSGSLSIGPYSTLRGGSNGSGPVADLDVPNVGQVQIVVDPRATPMTYVGPQPYTVADVHATYHSWLVAGEDYSVRVAGPPNGWAILGVGCELIQPLNVGIGLLAMEPSSVLVMGLRSLDATGFREWLENCPAVVPVGHAFAFQAAVLDPNGTISLTVPSPFTVGWPHGVIP